MPKSLDLLFGIMMSLTGVLFLAWIPKTRAHWNKEQQVGKISAQEVQKNTRNVKLIGFCCLILGICLILAYLFDLYD